MWRPVHHKIIAQLADGLTTFLSFFVAYYLWGLLKRTFPQWAHGPEIKLEGEYVILIAVAAWTAVIIFNVQKAYSYQRFTSFMTEVQIVLKTIIIWWLLLISAMFMCRQVYVPRTLLVMLAVVNFCLLTCEKYCLFGVAKIIRHRGKNRKTVLIVGTGDQTKRFVETIQKHFSWGLDIKGFLDAAQENVGKEMFGKKILGTINDISRVLHAYPVDEVIITVSTRRMEEIRGVLEICAQEGVQARIVSNFLGKIAKQIRTDVIYQLPIISVSYVPDHKAALALKRMFDLLVSALLLILLAPLLVCITLAIKLTSEGPLFYQWNVVGLNKRPFTSWKFRTMVVDADRLKQALVAQNEMQGPVFKIRADPRITPLGRILRKYSLDELPQLWSVLKGDMSLVGPRPAGPHELERYEGWHRRKLSIKPGITCFWQVNGRNRITNFDEWVKMDLEYIDNWSFKTDMHILWRTFLTVLRGTGC